MSSLVRPSMAPVSRVTAVHTAVRNCTRDEGRSFLRQDKSRKGERECDLKPFVAVQRVKLPPGKGRSSQPEASFAWVVATPLVKRRQQVLKPRGSPEISITLKPSL